MKYNTMKISTRLFFTGLTFLILELFVQCEKEKMPYKDVNPTFETDSVADVDGNVYKTIKIGEQWWMAENLKVTHYRNMDPIKFDLYISDTTWTNLTEGIYCYLNNNPVTYSGFLYNWYAVNNPEGIAPEGWRVPSDEDWMVLENYLGMSSYELENIGWRGTTEGAKMKTTHDTKYLSWAINPAVHNTNESGFSALPGAGRVFNGLWGEPGITYTGFWWTSTPSSNGQVWYRYLDYKSEKVFRYYTPKSSGYSIRCIKE